jgi:hypothetical protein
MSKIKNATIVVKGTEITVIKEGTFDYISLTDMLKSFGDDTMLYNWLRNRNTIEFLGIWEQLNNPDFKPHEFDRFKNEAGLNRFNLSPKKWIEGTNAIGIISKAGRYGGGTFAHRDIAFEFGSWLSAEFKLYLIKEFQRLKEEEGNLQQMEWSLQRTLAKVNYRIHTDAIKENLVPPEISKEQRMRIYASEADVLNTALFGQTAAEWRQANLGKTGNIRDVASLEQLVVLSNLESLNAMLVHQQLSQQERLIQLNNIAITQMRSLLQSARLKKLK